MSVEVGTAYLTIIPSARGFASRLQGELAGEFRQALGGVPEEGARAGRSFAQRFRGSVSSGLRGLGGLIGAAAKAGGVGIAAGLAALTAFGLKSAATLEQTRVSFNSLAGSVEAGGKIFADLQKFAATTPFEFTDLTQTAGRFLAFAQSAGIARSELIPFLTTVGNIASVTGGGPQALNSVSLAMGQIASSGKLTLDNLNQISEALPGFSGVAAIASATGLTTAEVMKKISAGEIDAVSGLSALLKGMREFPGAAGAMEAQSQTLLGTFSTFKDTVSQALAGAFAPVIPAIKDSLAEVTPIIGAAIDQLAPALGELVATVLPVVGQVVSALVPVITPLIDALGPALKGLTSGLAPMSASIGEVVSALAPLLPQIATLIGSLTSGLAPVLSTLAPVLGSVGGLLLNLLAPLSPILTTIAGTLGAVLGPIASTLVTILDSVGPVLGEVLGLLGGALAPVLGVLAPVLVQLLDALAPLFPVLAVLAKPLTDIIVALLPLIELMAQLLVIGVAIIAPLIKVAALLLSFLASKAVAPLIGLIAKALGFVLSPLSKLSGLLEGVSKWINNIDWGKTGKAILHGLLVALKAVGGFFADLGKTIGGAVASAFSAVVAFFGRLPGMLLDRLKALPGQLTTLARAALDGFLFAIGFAIGFLIRQFIELPGRLAAGISALWSFVSERFRAGLAFAIAFVQQLPGRIAEIFTQARDRAVALTLALLTGVLHWVTDMRSRALSFVADMWTKAKASFLGGIDAVVGFVKGLPGRIGDGLIATKNRLLEFGSDAVQSFKDMGGRMIDGLIDGLKASVGRAVDAVKDVGKSIISGAKKGLGIASPAKKMIPVGESTVDGFVVGVDRKAGDAAAAIADALRPPTAPLNAYARTARAGAPAAPVPGATTNVYPQRADFTIEDLEALDDRRNVMARGGRPD